MEMKLYKGTRTPARAVDDGFEFEIKQKVHITVTAYAERDRDIIQKLQRFIIDWKITPISATSNQDSYRGSFEPADGRKVATWLKAEKKRRATERRPAKRK
jgi:hypothetical protein